MHTEVGFRLAGGAQPLIIVPASVNGDGPHQFILDTGAGTSLLTPELAGRLNVAVTGSKEGTGAGGKVIVSLGVVESLAIGQARAENLEVAITDEVHRIGAAIGAKLDGDIGYNFLKEFKVTIDYPNETLRLEQACYKGARPRSPFPMRRGRANPLLFYLSGKEGAPCPAPSSV